MGSLELVEATEVLAPGELTLAELAETANREHELTVQAGAAMVEHALRAGDALLAAKARMPRGEWKQWVTTNFSYGSRWAYEYMRVSYYRESLPSDVLTLTEAKAHIRGLPRLRKVSAKGQYDALEDEARRLHARGDLSQLEIAEILGVGNGTVSRWVNPRVREKQDRHRRATQRQWHAARKALQREQREKAITLAVRKNGGALAEAYAMVSKLDMVLGQARQDAETKDSRLAINEAHALRDKMMEQIVRALGVS